jgi:hypothetical protein
VEYWEIHQNAGEDASSHHFIIPTFRHSGAIRLR